MDKKINQQTPTAATLKFVRKIFQPRITNFVLRKCLKRKIIANQHFISAGRAHTHLLCFEFNR